MYQQTSVQGEPIREAFGPDRALNLRATRVFLNQDFTAVRRTRGHNVSAFRGNWGQLHRRRKKVGRQRRFARPFYELFNKCPE